MPAKPGGLGGENTLDKPAGEVLPATKIYGFKVFMCFMFHYSKIK